VSSAAVLDRVATGGRMSAAEAERLYVEAPDEGLRACAVAVRNRFSDPTQVTYLVDRNINYTNVCITDCKFCEFYRPPGHAEAYVLSREILAQKLQELVDAGGCRVLLQGGHHPELRLAWYEDLLRWMLARFPSIEIDGFSPSEIENLALIEDLPVETVLVRLKDAGLGGVPGGGAEILDDEIRAIVSPKKTKTKAWLRVMEIAHELRLYTSASQVFGFGEEPQHRVRALQNLRDQQDRSLARFGHGFLAFVTWPLLFESRYGEVFGRLKGWKLGASAKEYLRHVAFCRCFLDNIPHLQASWPTMGLDTAAEGLHSGCDDMGGTMMEENVVSRAGSVHCSVTETMVRARIEAAGFVPRKRDSWYRTSDPRAAVPS
jgi:cyclic dehypoxanthinyl futalosine synthase